MPQRVTCPGCRNEFEAPDEAGYWLTCLRCGILFVNPSLSATWTGFLGGLLIVGGLCGGVCFGPAAVVLGRWEGRLADEPGDSVLFLLNLVSSGFVIGAGAMLYLAGPDPVRRRTMQAAAALAVLAALALLITSGLFRLFLFAAGALPAFFFALLITSGLFGLFLALLRRL